jgi:hypothetical protein
MIYAQDERRNACGGTRYCCPILTQTDMCRQILVKFKETKFIYLQIVKCGETDMAK